MKALDRMYRKFRTIWHLGSLETKEFSGRHAGWIRAYATAGIEPVSEKHGPSCVEEMAWCSSKMGTTSRSFAFVTKALPPELCQVVTLFYLTLRALDTIEDGNSFDRARKKIELLTFHTHLRDPSWTIQRAKDSNCGDNPAELELLDGFNKVATCIQHLDDKYTNIIQRTCREMGKGMIQFLGRPLTTRTDYESYCYFVAGIVGEALSQIFVVSGHEKKKLLSPEFLRQAVALGTFLQKTNIIRDGKEDFEEGRVFWPRAVWNRYVASYADLYDPLSRRSALLCSNELVRDALQHIEASIEYLHGIENPLIFRFCAIPQVMAIATLSACYNNYELFRGKVSIPRADTLRISSVSDLGQVLRFNVDYAQTMLMNVSHQDPEAGKTEHLLRTLITKLQGY